MSFNTEKYINVEGVVLPNEPLSNFQLIDAAKKLKIKHFRGVYVRDELPKSPKKEECGILNLCDSRGNGTHWTAWIKNGHEKLYFDSYGLAPPVELVSYIRNPVYYNSERVQTDGEVFCGHLCLYILKQCESVSLQHVINSLY
jgi:hypothetical protein